MAQANLVILVGRIASPIRYGYKEDLKQNCADFWVETDEPASKDGKIQTFRNLCRVMGAVADSVKGLELGHEIIIEGKLRGIDGLKYVQAYKVSYHSVDKTVDKQLNL